MSIGSPAHSTHQRTAVDRVSQDMWEHQDTPLISVYVSQCSYAAGMLPQCGHLRVLSLRSLQPVLELLNHSVLASTASLAPSRRTPVGHATRDMSQPAVKERIPSATNPALVSTRWGTHAHVAMCFIHVHVQCLRYHVLFVRQIHV